MMHTVTYKYTQKFIAVIITILFCTSLWQLAAAGWIQGKSIIAQQLLNYSWNRTLLQADKSASYKTELTNPYLNKPWPWADTWPVAKLTAPQHGIEQIILAGDSGSSLAFGPGYSLASAMPNTIGTTLISAHRDTHFQFLKDIIVDDIIELQTVEATFSYRVYDIQIVDSKTYTLRQNTDDRLLVLATCHPFDAIMSGGPSRYLVFATIQAVQNRVTEEAI